MEQPGAALHSEAPAGEPRVFLGYPLPTSSTTYTPNQFFDVVLPHASRGCLRLVAYLIRKTLGWSDAEGNPQHPETHVSYRELIKRAGISRGAIRASIDEAIEKRYIDCLSLGQSHLAGKEGFSALYSLRWNEIRDAGGKEKYVTDPEEFDGFFAGEGNLTHIPNDFFDHTVPNEPLAVVGVVGAVIRNSIGWQTRYGMRRQSADLSFTQIMKRTGIKSRSTVSEAIKAAIERRHIVRLAKGRFDPFEGAPATYAVRWLDTPEPKPSLVLVEPGNGDGSEIAPGSEGDRRFRNRTSPEGTVQKSHQPLKATDGSEIAPADGPGIAPATVQKSHQRAFKSRTTKKTTDLNNPSKQQAKDAGVEGRDSLALLKGELVGFGIHEGKATQLVRSYPEEAIRRQLGWIDRRKATTSRTGLLIAAIERDLPDPTDPADVQRSERSAATLFAAHFAAELVGNSGEPVGEPSTPDERAAAQILERLGTEAEGISLGRRFARWVLKADQASRSPVRTLPLAARLYGNAFVAAQEARSAPKAPGGGERVGQPSKDPLEGLYAAFARETAARIEEADPAVTEDFERAMDAKIHRRGQMSARAAEMLRKQLGSEEGRTELLAEHLSETEPDLIPGRAEWEREIFSDRINHGTQMEGGV